MIKPFRFKTASLRWALVAYVVVPLLGLAALGSYLSLTTIEREIEQRMEEEVALIARAIGLPLGRSLEENRKDSLQSALESVFRINRVYGAYIYDAEGNRILSLGKPDPIHSKDHLAQVAATGQGQGEYGTLGGREEVFSYFVPLPDSSNRINGLLQVTRRKNEFDDNIRAWRLQSMGGLLLIGTLMTGLIVYGHERAIGRHLNRLVESMAKVGGGDRNHRTKPEGPHEIRILATAFNTMLDSMTNAEAEIERRQEIEANLQQRLRQNEKFAVIGELAAGVAHELGGPLSVIGGKAQRALRNLNEGPEKTGEFVGIPEKTRRWLEDIRTEVSRMEQTVRQLLDFGPRTSRQQRIIFANHLIWASVAAIRNEAELAGVHLSVTESSCNPTLTGDPLRLQQALVNLIRNGIQAVPEGHVALEVTATETEVAFIVDDNGPGLPFQIRSKLFEPFVTTKRAGQGTGLGLTIVHSIVNDHDGKITVSRSPLSGARFTIILSRQIELPPKENSHHT